MWFTLMGIFALSVYGLLNGRCLILEWNNYNWHAQQHTWNHYNQRAVGTEIKSIVWATASKRYIPDCMSKYALSTQNRRFINSLYTLYKDVDKTLTVRGTFRNVATRLVRHSTYSIYDMSFRRIHSISWPKCVYTDEHVNTVMD